MESEAIMTDEELEKAIDDMGREKVFSKAKELGWSFYVMPPK